jgi:hypothetical protein
MPTLFVRMPVVDIREMRMAMPHRRMDVPMGVRFGAVPFERMRMLVMLVVYMSMSMF